MSSRGFLQKGGHAIRMDGIDRHRVLWCKARPRRGCPKPKSRDVASSEISLVFTCSLTFLPRPACWFVCNLRSRDYLPTYLPIYGKALQNYFHVWVDPQVPTYLTYLPTYHPNLMATIVRPPDVFLWSWTSSMPFSASLAGLVRKMGGKWSSNLRTFGLTMRVTAI